MLKMRRDARPSGVVEDAQQAVDPVVDECERTALAAAIDELDRLPIEDARQELRDDPRTALFRLVDIVEVRPDEIERPEERVIEVVARSIGKNHAVQHLFRCRIDPALLVDRAVDQRARFLVQHAVGRHAVNLGRRRKHQALAVLHALANDRQVRLEIELEYAQRVLHVLCRVRDRDQRHDDIAFLDVIFDPFPVDRDVAFHEFEPGTRPKIPQLVVGQVDAVDLPVGAPENGTRQGAANETIGPQDHDFHWHRPRLARHDRHRRPWSDGPAGWPLASNEG